MKAGLLSETIVYLPFIAKNLSTFSDDFSDPNSGWPVVGDAVGSVRYIGGEYGILFKQANYFYRAGHNLLAGDFQVDVDTRALTLGLDGANGLYFISDNSGFYAYQIRPNSGDFALRRRDAATGNWTYILGPTTLSAIRTDGQANHLTVTRRGSSVKLYANGVLVGQASLATGQGYVGLMASGYQATYEARFDNFVINYAAAGTSPMGLSSTVNSDGGEQPDGAGKDEGATGWE